MNYYYWQVRTMLSFKEEGSDQTQSPMGEDLRESLVDFHAELLRHCNHHPPEEEEPSKEAKDVQLEAESNKPLLEKILAYITNRQPPALPVCKNIGPGLQSSFWHLNYCSCYHYHPPPHHRHHQHHFREHPAIDNRNDYIVGEVTHHSRSESHQSDVQSLAQTIRWCGRGEDPPYLITSLNAQLNFELLSSPSSLSY